MDFQSGEAEPERERRENGAKATGSFSTPAFSWLLRMAVTLFVSFPFPSFEHVHTAASSTGHAANALLVQNAVFPPSYGLRSPFRERFEPD